MPNDFASLLQPLCELVFQASEIALDERPKMKRALKPDGSVVTSADVAIEEFLRPKLAELKPGSTIWGEELGHAFDEGNGVWLIDPIDGTTNYSFGSPLWGISVAFAHSGELELGAVMLPDLNEIYLVARGMGATVNGEPLPSIPEGEIRQEELVGACDHVTAIIRRDLIPGKLRCSGAFVVEGAFVACQRMRGLIGIREKLYDVAPCILMANELGAEVRYADGSPLIVADHFDDQKFGKPWIIFPRNSGFVA